MKFSEAKLIAEKCKLNRREANVFTALAQFSDKNDECRKSVKDIAGKSLYCIKSVQIAIKKLVSINLLERTLQYFPDGGLDVNLYKLINPYKK